MLKWNKVFILSAVFFVSITGAFGAGGDASDSKTPGINAESSEKNQVSVETRMQIFKAETAEAKSVLRGLSERQMDSLVEEFKKDRTLEENRYIWVIEELAARKADRIAADRLFYVFLAIVFTGLLMLVYVIRIHTSLRKMKED